MSTSRSAGPGVERALAWLRPHPHRGDIIAAGAVPLALFAIVVELRMRHWSLGARFAVVAIIADLILSMGLLAELEGPAPRPYHSILLVSGLLPLALALVLLAEIMGANRPPGSGGIAWTFAVEGLLATYAARRANSGVCTLIAAVSFGVALEAFIVLVFKPHGLGTFRAILVVLTLAFAAGAVRFRDGRRRHAVQLVNAGGLAGLVLAITYNVQSVALSSIVRGGAVIVDRFEGPGSAPFGWKLYLLALGFALIAYAAVDREPGPAYIGLVVLLAFALLAGIPGVSGASLVGWPLFLLIIGAGALAIGLRPRRPLPPPPTSRSQPAPTVPLDPSGGGPPTVPLRPIDSDE
jgi:hypothetical protein